jgi:hypothetical protein
MSPPKRIIFLAAFALVFVAGAAVVMAVRPPAVPANTPIHYLSAPSE